MNHWKRLLEPMKVAKLSILIIVLRGIYRGIFGVSIAYGIKLLSNALIAKDRDTFMYYFIILAVLFLLKSLPGYIVRKHQSIFLCKVQVYIYEQYLQKYLYITGNAADKLGTGLTNNIIQKGCDNRVYIVERIPQNWIELIIGMTFSFVTIFLTVGRKISITIVAILIAVWFFAQWANNYVAIYRKERRDFYSQGDRHVVKIIMTKQEILQAGNIKKEIDKNNSIMDNVLVAWSKQHWYNARAFDGQRGVVDMIRLALLGYIGRGVIQGSNTIGDFAMIRMLCTQINEHIANLNDYITQYHQNIIYVQKLRDTFDTTPRIQGYDTGDTFLYKKGNINLKNISFGYGESNEVFQDFCLDIPGGKKIALVGLSGSGKTTLMKMIAGYLRPESGKVVIDGQDLMDVSLQSYYQHIGYLTQEPSIFDGTIRENLEYATQETGSKKQEASILDNIIKLAKCEFIYDFPLGLDTEIGEKGIRLSGGQRQRLAIAKIFLKNPEIILLDEPTSALDSFSEESVTQAMENLFKGRTVIIIAHRLQTVKSADEILLLEDGAIVERGNHKALLDRDGVYRKMVEMQSGF